MTLQTPLTRLLGTRYPIIQGGMSWASSNAALALAVSRAGGLGVIAAGPMYPEALLAAIREVRAGTDAPYAVNIPLYNKRAQEHMDIALAEGVPVIIASQGGPQKHIGRAREAGVKWLQVIASPEHAAKAEAAGVDAVIAVGLEAGGHPGPDEIGLQVLLRSVVRRVSVPVVAAGGIADGAGIAAALCLGAAGAQLGTRFLLTPEAGVCDAYKDAVLAAGVADTTLVGRGRSPVRMLRNAFARDYLAAERGGDEATLETMFAGSSLKQAAFDGDVQGGKVEAGQSAGLIDSLQPAGAVVEQLVAETRDALRRAALLVG
ncbi:NAD(P)H-dependent flavin oxidoreductase [Achromobacter insuavis]|uniref:NAD(P)H-dependent flavin oxidoreductase n=1 Tax=Achromobacter insuavis TaxID=1287735 RepID=UPI001468A4F7|nr:nitronate monooxygenase [Achromobacter insuavis]CAB3842692.1 NADH:quinone reductase [Achromobacter insuavis]